MATGQDQISALRVLANPVRLRILSMLHGRTLSATDIAQELNIRHASASYHVRKLREAELIELAGTRSIRGGLEQRYRNRRSLELGTPRNIWGNADLQLVIEALAVELRRRAVGAPPERISFIDGDFWIGRETLDHLRKEILLIAQRLVDDAQPPKAPGAVPVSVSALMFRTGEEIGG